MVLRDGDVAFCSRSRASLIGSLTVSVVGVAVSLAWLKTHHAPTASAITITNAIIFPIIPPYAYSIHHRNS
jgi:dolichol kinase